AVGVAGTVGLIAGVLLYQGERTRVFQQDALLARQELEDVRRRSDAQDLVRQGREAVAKQDWRFAELRLIGALAKIGLDDPALEELRIQAQNLMNEVQRGLQKQELRQQTVSRFDQFLKGRDDTLFHATLATGEGLAANVRATRDKARQTLALWNE